MMAEKDFGLTKRDLDTIQSILSSYPDVICVRIFGSRAKGDAAKGSDIDLAIMNSEFDPRSLAALRDDFEESDLPYRVDLVDYSRLGHKELRDHIDRVGVLFYEKQDQN